MGSLLKAVMKWLMDDQRSIVEQIALGFALITVANSVMMVVGWDRPKVGSFAYLHLLVRLGIVTAVVMVWEHGDVLETVRGWASKRSLEVDQKTARAALQEWLRGMQADWLSFVNVVFTTVVMLVCVGAVVLQSWIEPAGGTELYWSLLVLYAALYVGVFSIRRR